MAEVVLKVENLTKMFKDRIAVKNISFEIKQGEIFGLLGPNGAGKTTTMRAICGLCKMDKGNITICGHSITKDCEQAIVNVGGMIENPLMYTYMSGYDNLKYYSNLYKKKTTKEEILGIAKIVGLENRIKDKVRSYSLGMRQRLGIAQALLHDPKLLILDEPMSGLDPARVIEIREFLKLIARQNKIAIMISSHMLSEMENLCDTLAIMDNGDLLQVKSVEELKKGSANNRKIKMQVDYPNFAGKVVMYEFKYPVEVAGDSILIQADQEQISTIAKTLIDNKLSIFSVSFIDTTLEEIFMDIVNNKNNGYTGIM